MTQAHVLIVEDEAVVALDLEASLTELGYHVVGVSDTGAEALEKAEQYRPDVVLMDIQLRGPMDGIETAAHIRARYAVPVLYLTAHSDEATLQRARVTEPHGFILKPFENSELYSNIEMALYKHQSERALNESHLWLSTTLNSVGDAVLTTDHTGCVKLVNPVALHLLGFTESEVVGTLVTDLFQIVTATDQAPLPSGVAEVLQDGAPIRHNGILLQSSNRDKPIPVDYFVNCIRTDPPRAFGAVVVFRDISEKLQLERALRERVKLEATGQLAAGLAHELNNLLTVIMGYTGMIREDVPETHEWYGMLGSIQLAGTQASEHINHMLAFGQKRRMRPMNLELRDQLGTMAQTLSVFFGPTTRVTMELGSAPCWVWMDPAGLQEVILHLARNSRDAMPQGGQFTLSLTMIDQEPTLTDSAKGTGPFARITLCDTGAGMDDETCQHVFDPFFTTKEIGQGSGLSMSMVYGTIKQSGGHIRVTSVLGQGTTVTIWLPLSAES